MAERRKPAKQGKPKAELPAPDVTVECGVCFRRLPVAPERKYDTPCPTGCGVLMAPAKGEDGAEVEREP